MIIDLDTPARERLRRHFARRGWSVALATTVTEARARLDPPPHCILLELTLGDGPGEDLIVLAAGPAAGLIVRQELPVPANPMTFRTARNPRDSHDPWLAGAAYNSRMHESGKRVLSSRMVTRRDSRLNVVTSTVTEGAESSAGTLSSSADRNTLHCVWAQSQLPSAT